MKIIRILIKTIFSLFLIFSLICFACVIYVNSSLPTHYQVYEGDNLSVACAIPLEVTDSQTTDSMPAQTKLRTAGSRYEVNLKILGLLPAKTVSVRVVEQNSVMVLGNPFGIKIYADGVMVVGTTDVDTSNGLKNPALSAGIKKGDIITLIDGLSVFSNENIAEIIEQSHGDSLNFTVIRNGRKMVFKVKPLKSKTDNKYRIGIWVRDSSAGIGTFTFYNPKEKLVAGLGHAICDNDTGEIIPLNHGELVGADILSVEKGTSGAAGELKGIFKNAILGKFVLNCQTGVYGKVNDNVSFSGEYYQIANKQDIISGQAEILTTIEGNNPKKYKCEIEKVHFNDDSQTQNMIIKITDKELLRKTGGIVQGMSGSPIIQNGKLIGSITHVFVNDSTRGYAIFAENMIETASGIQKDKLNKAS